MHVDFTVEQIQQARAHARVTRVYKNFLWLRFASSLPPADIRSALVRSTETEPLDTGRDREVEEGEEEEQEEEAAVTSAASE